MTFLRDLRFAARQLRLAPGYSLAAIATLALAIGASTAIFSAVYAVLLKPMPIRDPGSLVVGWGTSAALNMRVIELSYLEMRDIGGATPAVGKRRVGGFVVLDRRARRRGRAGEGADDWRVRQLLRAAWRRAATGTNDSPRRRHHEERAGRWSSATGCGPGSSASDPNVIGRRVRLDDQDSHEVVGVMPASFNYPHGTEVWRRPRNHRRSRPRGGNPNPLHNVGVMFMVGRLNAGVTPEAAQATNGPAPTRRCWRARPARGTTSRSRRSSTTRSVRRGRRCGCCSAPSACCC